MTLKRMFRWGTYMFLFIGVIAVSANDIHRYVEPSRMLNDSDTRCLAAHLFRQTSPNSHRAVGSGRRDAEAEIELKAIMLIDYHNALTPSICDAVMEVESLSYVQALGDRRTLESERGVRMLRNARRFLQKE